MPRMKRCLRAGKHLSRYPPWALDKPSGREATAANLRRQGHAPAILDARCAKKPRQSKEDAAWAGSKPAHGSGQPGFYNKHGERHKREKGGDQNIHTVSNPSFGSGRSLSGIKEQCRGGAKNAEGSRRAKCFFMERASLVQTGSSQSYDALSRVQTHMHGLFWIESFI